MILFGWKIWTLEWEARSAIHSMKVENRNLRSNCCRPSEMFSVVYFFVWARANTVPMYWKNVKGNTWRCDLQQMRFYCHILQQLIRLAAVAAQTRKRARADSRDHYRNNWPLALSHAIVWNLSSRLQEPLILWNLTGLKHLVILLAVPVALFTLSYACLWLLKSKCSWLHVLQILLMFADVSDMYTKLYE